MSTRTISEPPSSLNSPQQQQRERATSTFSTTLGLAKLLNERGIHAMVPKAITTMDKVASPPPTPAPSPEGSPPPTPVPISGMQVPDLINATSLSRGLHLLRRSRSKKSKKSESANCPSVSSNADETKTSQAAKFGLLDKLSRIGLENIMSTTASEVPPSIAECSTMRFSRISSKLKTIDNNTSLTLTPKTDAGVKTRIDLSFTSSNSSTRTTNSHICSSYSSQSWGYVPSVTPVINSITSVTSVSSSTSHLSKFAIRQNHVHDLQRAKSSSIGTIGTLRTLRKGGYV